MRNITAALIVGANVKAELVRRGITQAELAAHLGITQSQLSKRLRAAVTFDVDELAAISAYLDVPAADLLAEHAALSA